MHFMEETIILERECFGFQCIHEGHFRRNSVKKNDRYKNCNRTFDFWISRWTSRNAHEERIDRIDVSQLYADSRVFSIHGIPVWFNWVRHWRPSKIQRSTNYRGCVEFQLSFRPYPMSWHLGVWTDAIFTKEPNNIVHDASISYIMLPVTTWRPTDTIFVYLKIGL